MRDRHGLLATIKQRFEPGANARDAYTGYKFVNIMLREAAGTEQVRGPTTLKLEGTMLYQSGVILAEHIKNQDSEQLDEVRAHRSAPPSKEAPMI